MSVTTGFELGAAQRWTTRLPRGKGLVKPVVLRIAVVDPLPLFRHGVATVLEAAGHTVDTPADVVTWVRRGAGTLVLLTVGSDDDWELLGKVCETAPGGVVIALLDNASSAIGARAVRTGARSVLPRGATAMVLSRTVEATISGQAVMPAPVAAALAAGAQGSGQHVTIDEMSWLRRLAAGSTVAELAEQAGYSERAMFRLLQELYRKMGVNTRLQAIMRAKETGWF